jgi:hypothetical protein
MAWCMSTAGRREAVDAVMSRESLTVDEADLPAYNLISSQLNYRLERLI